MKSHYLNVGLDALPNLIRELERREWRETYCPDYFHSYFAKKRYRCAIDWQHGGIVFWRKKGV